MEKTVKELKEIAKEKGITIPRGITKAKLIELIDSNNKPINKNVISDEEIIPKGFTSLPPKPIKSDMIMIDGKPYKKISDNYYMGCQDGKIRRA